MNSTKLSKCDLSRADFSHAKLNDARLTESNLNGATFAAATLQEAGIYRVRAKKANFEGAQMQRAKLAQSNLEGANLTRAELNGATLSGVVLKDAVFCQTVLTGASLVKAKLGGVNLADTRFDGANMAGADLSGADLGSASFDGVDLRGADLTDVELEHASFLGAKVAGVVASSETKNVLRSKGADMSTPDTEGQQYASAWTTGPRVVAVGHLHRGLGPSSLHRDTAVAVLGLALILFISVVVITPDRFSSSDVAAGPEPGVDTAAGLSTTSTTSAVSDTITVLGAVDNAVRPDMPSIAVGSPEYPVTIEVTDMDADTSSFEFSVDSSSPRGLPLSAGLYTFRVRGGPLGQTECQTFSDGVRQDWSNGVGEVECTLVLND